MLWDPANFSERRRQKAPSSKQSKNPKPLPVRRVLSRPRNKLCSKEALMARPGIPQVALREEGHVNQDHRRPNSDEQDCMIQRLLYSKRGLVDATAEHEAPT